MARDYNPRYGWGSGRVGEDDVSFDGKSWNYRDPSNLKAATPGQVRPGMTRGEDDYNPHSQKMLNPLYNFAYGDVEATARKLGIGNFNKEEEVAQTVDYLRNRFNQSDDTVEDSAPEPEYVPDPGTSLADADSISDQLASARAYAPTYQDSMKSGSLNPTSDDYQANADDFLNAYQNRFMDISNRVRGIG